MCHALEVLMINWIIYLATNQHQPGVNHAAEHGLCAAYTKQHYPLNTQRCLIHHEGEN